LRRSFTMQCLTVRQPFAWAIIQGPKRIENRSRPTSHRGPLAIHAGLTKAEFKGRDFYDLMPGLPGHDDLTYGAIIGFVDVVDCLPFEAAKDQPFAEPLGWCWILANPRPLDEPVPMMGRLGLFDVELDPSVLPSQPAQGPETTASDDAAELRAFRVRYKARFKTGDFPPLSFEAKRAIRRDAAARGLSPQWALFMGRFGFQGEIAEALARSLETPTECHVGWFFEAMMSVRRADLDLSALSYEVIKTAIEDWREERRAAVQATVSQ
jgi:ASCH domain